MQASEFGSPSAKVRATVSNDLGAELVSVHQHRMHTPDSASFILRPKVLEGMMLKLYEAETEGSYIIEANRQATYWREAREGPDPENQHHDSPAPRRDGLKWLYVSIMSSIAREGAWEQLHLVPRHSMVRRQALALNRQPKDNRADFVNYYFDESLARQLSPSEPPASAARMVKVHQAVCGVAVFRDGVAASVLGLRVGSMTEVGWIYCGYRDHSNRFVPCDLILSEAPETVGNMARLAAARNESLTEGEESGDVSSSSEDSDGLMMRRLAFRDKVM